MAMDLLWEQACSMSYSPHPYLIQRSCSLVLVGQPGYNISRMTLLCKREINRQCQEHHEVALMYAQLLSQATLLYPLTETRQAEAGHHNQLLFASNTLVCWAAGTILPNSLGNIYQFGKLPLLAQWNLGARNSRMNHLPNKLDPQISRIKLYS